MNKGSLNLSLENIIGLIIVGIVVPGLAYFAISILSVVTKTTDQGTINSFEQLIYATEDLLSVSYEDVSKDDKTIKTDRYGDEIKLDSSKSNNVFVEVPSYIQKGRLWIGFDKEEIVYNKDIYLLTFFTGTKSEEKLKRPSVCLNKPCICLAKDLKNKEESYERCQYFDNINEIYLVALQKDTQYNVGTTHSGGYYLILHNKDGKFQVSNVKIVKTPSSVAEKSNIFLQVFPK